ncbi:tyrosine recombinase XerC [uncultured Pseudonocardia sp.]|uniref:site-specific integrase n=1 Tax=uncultured Pseudonocardia sp. TaxID=211455 RepID=UPI00261567CE|nr:tyrosine-type recombinase/integrase [uncultured Pseudonocardia sp.]
MASGNTAQAPSQPGETTSGNTARTGGGAAPLLSVELTAALAGYQRALTAAPLSASSRRKYAARVRGFLIWLDTAQTDPDLDGDPLGDPAARDGAVRDWRAWAKTVARHRATTINNTLAALDDFYTRRGLGPASARREALPRHAPKALAHRELLRYLRAVEHCGSARDTVVALLPFYAGLRVCEVVGLDLDDIALSARKGRLRVRGKGRDGGKLRELPLTRPELRTALAAWLEQRPTWPGADHSAALLLNRRGGRLSDRSARTIITGLGEQVGLGDRDGPGFGPHIG